MKNQPYAKLFEISKQSSLLHSVQSLVEWDHETYMPIDAIEHRSMQLELLANLTHKHKTSKQFSRALDALIDIDTGKIKDEKLSAPQQAALREWRRDFIKAVKLPSSFVKRFAKTVSIASHVWKTARQHNDFRSFAPHLEKVVSLSRKKADILGFEDHPYDALLDLYEPDVKTSELTALFEKLKEPLKELLRAIMSKPQFQESFLYRDCPKGKQLEFCNKILHAMGFEETNARLDQSAHPFCTGLHPLDTRMTTTIHPDNIFQAISSTMHEGGHGLYNKGLPAEHYGSPLCEPISLGIDESQSRFWETIIGQSDALWQHFFPLLQRDFPDQFGSIDFQDFYQAINAVKPNLIRIEADEVTYNMHIIIRFEIEKGLMEGTLQVKDLPYTWNEKMREYLGIVPEYDGAGCLQDIHWSLGYIGYFPTYTLGNLYAAQFFGAFVKAHPHWKEKLAKGNLSFIREWLQTHIHTFGRQYTSAELCTKLTGRPLSEQPFVDYLNGKYKSLYQIS